MSETVELQTLSNDSNVEVLQIQDAGATIPEKVLVHLGKVFRGKSAYEQAVDGGYTESEEKFKEQLAIVNEPIVIELTAINSAYKSGGVDDRVKKYYEQLVANPNRRVIVNSSNYGKVSVAKIMEYPSSNSILLGADTLYMLSEDDAHAGSYLFVITAEGKVPRYINGEGNRIITSKNLIDDLNGSFGALRASQGKVLNEAKIGWAEYDSARKEIVLYNDKNRSIEIGAIDAIEFIKDGMINGVSIDENTQIISITFNTDAGKQDIKVNLAGILANKVDKVPGKGLSTNDYTDEEKAEVAKIVDKIPENTVSYSPQELTPAEQGQARKNIDAAPSYMQSYFLIQSGRVDLFDPPYAEYSKVGLFKRRNIPVLYKTSASVDFVFLTWQGADYYSQTGIYRTSNGIGVVTLTFDFDEENDEIKVASEERHIIPINSTNDTAISLNYNNISDGLASLAEGARNITSAMYSHVEGQDNVIEADASGAHAEGGNNVVRGVNAHGEGQSNMIDGTASHGEGRNNTTNGAYTHIEGYNNTISDVNYAHAEGRKNKIHTKGHAGHVEGYLNEVAGYYGHAEGEGNIVNGNRSHGGGKGNTIDGADTIVHGVNNAVSGNKCAVFGEGNQVTADNCAVFGRYSESVKSTDKAKATAFCIGNGTSSAPSNLFEIKANGDVYINGKKVVITFEE